MNKTNINFNSLSQEERAVIRQKNVTDFPGAFVDPASIKRSNPTVANKTVHQDYPILDSTGHFTKAKVLMLDPPWNIQQKGKLGAQQHYDLLNLEEIAKLPINDLLEENGAVFLWVTNAVLPFAFDLLKRWGLEYRSVYTFCKPRLGLGVYLRNSTEQLLLATKGKAPVQFHGQMNWGLHPLQSHSAKPEEIYEIIERLYPGPYLELFARARHPGWHTWGYESPGGSDIVIPGFPVPSYTFDLSNIHPEIQMKLKNSGAGDA